MTRQDYGRAVDRGGRSSALRYLLGSALLVVLLGVAYLWEGDRIQEFLGQEFLTDSGDDRSLVVEDEIAQEAVEPGPAVPEPADREPALVETGESAAEESAQQTTAQTEPAAVEAPAGGAGETAAEDPPAETEPTVKAEAGEPASAAGETTAATAEVPTAAATTRPASEETVMSDDEAALGRARGLLAGGNAEGARQVLLPLAERGLPGALAQLGFLQLHGKGQPADPAKGFELLTRAAEAGDAEGQYYLADAYLSGTGTGTGAEADDVLALAWFMQAAARGHPEAIAERDRGLGEADEGIRVRAASKARSLAVPLPPGWLTDQEKGISVWGPSWFRNGTWHVAIDGQAVDGMVEGEASVILTASLSGDTSRTYEGRFTRGLWLDEALLDVAIGFLQSDEYRLPMDAAASGHAAIRDLWVQHEMEGLEITACSEQAPNLFAVMRPDFTGIEDEAVKAVAVAAVKAYMALCPVSGNTPGNVTLLPPDHVAVIDRGDTSYAPQLATMQLYGFDQPAETWSINLKNLARRAHEEREREAEEERKKAARAEKKARETAAAMAREAPDIRGVKLGIGLPELHDLLGETAVDWSPTWKPGRELPAFRSFEQKVTLADQSEITAIFASKQNGSRLLVLLYEQNLRDGPDPESLRQSLYGKYGKPDDEAGQRTWFTWWLKGSHDGKPKGAFLKGRIQTDQRSGRVDYLRLVLNDYDLSLLDERQGAEARRRAEQEAYENSKSDEVKF